MIVVGSWAVRALVRADAPRIASMPSTHRHLEIHEHDVVARGLASSTAWAPFVGEVDAVAAVGEERADEQASVFAVVGDEDAQPAPAAGARVQSTRHAPDAMALARAPRADRDV